MWIEFRSQRNGQRKGLIVPQGGYACDMATVLELSDDVVALLEEHAVHRGLTVVEFIREVAQHATPQQALDAFIGSADIQVDETSDIHRARTKIADELLQEHDELSENRMRDVVHLK